MAHTPLALGDFKQDPFDDEDGEDLEDVTEKWDNKWVFYSPKIVYGLDFDNKANAVDVFMVAKCNSVNPLQFSQMVARTRNIKKLHFWVAEKNAKLVFDTVEDVKASYHLMLKGFAATVKRLDKDSTDKVEAQEKLKCFKSMQNLVAN